MNIKTFANWEGFEMECGPVRVFAPGIRECFQLLCEELKKQEAKEEGSIDYGVLRDIKEIGEWEEK